MLIACCPRVIVEGIDLTYEGIATHNLMQLNVCIICNEGIDLTYEGIATVLVVVC